MSSDPLYVHVLLSWSWFYFSCLYIERKEYVPEKCSCFPGTDTLNALWFSNKAPLQVICQGFTDLYGGSIERLSDVSIGNIVITHMRAVSA